MVLVIVIAACSSTALMLALAPKIGWTTAIAISGCYFSLYLLIAGKN